MIRGDKVYDRWWPWRVGTITRMTKTRCTVKFEFETWVYDKAHMRFLEKVR